ncbi:MAG TPA: transcription termination/antitermination protein NusG [Isosphaeraceae bacterium]|jgi:transcriptional antiterminator NusG|nr:transcription termination/antitermination protein NusG [Isosphaeraceae bacterium]
MSHPTDETSEPDATQGLPPVPGEPQGDASIGPSNLFEVEELTPDGGPLTSEHAETAEPKPAAPREPKPKAAAREPKSKPEPPAEKTPPPQASVLLADDDEPPPTLVWYVLKVQSGREDTIRDALERRVKIQGLQRFFGRIVVPTEKITEIRNNKKRIVERKSYPGYIMVEMELNEKTWFTVRETPGVGDFVGAHGTPTKMTETEVNQMLGQETAKTEEAPRVRIDVERGDRVKIKDGPFENFEGTVEEVIEARGLVKVMLIIFNRPTPVDLEYWQVERI